MSPPTHPPIATTTSKHNRSPSTKTILPAQQQTNNHLSIHPCSTPSYHDGLQAYVPAKRYGTRFLSNWCYPTSALPDLRRSAETRGARNINTAGISTVARLDLDEGLLADGFVGLVGLYSVEVVSVSGGWDPALDPVLCSPYEEPDRFWSLDESGRTALLVVGGVSVGPC